MIYEKDKNHRLTLRVNDEQFDFLRENAEVLGITLTDFVRIVINTTLVSTKRLETERQRLEGKVYCRENEEADKHDIV